MGSGHVLGPVPAFKGLHRSGQRASAMRNVDLDLRRLHRSSAASCSLILSYALALAPDHARKLLSAGTASELT